MADGAGKPGVSVPKAHDAPGQLAEVAGGVLFMNGAHTVHDSPTAPDDPPTASADLVDQAAETMVKHVG